MQDFFGITTSFDWIITCIALFTLILICSQLILGLLGIGDWDLDVDGDGSFDFDASMFLTPIGIVRFLCGASWYLVLVNMAGRNTFWYDYFIAIFIGCVCFIFMALLYYGFNKLTHETSLETLEDLVGRSATVNIPMSNSTYIVNVKMNESITQVSAIAEDSEKQYVFGDIVTISSYKNGVLYIN